MAGGAAARATARGAPAPRAERFPGADLAAAPEPAARAVRARRERAGADLRGARGAAARRDRSGVGVERRGGRRGFPSRSAGAAPGGAGVVARHAGVPAVPRGISCVHHGEARAEAYGRAAPAAAGDDGRRIVSASDDSTLKVWDLASGKLLSTLEGASEGIDTLEEGHSGAVTACAISPDGQRIVSASNDRTLKVWDASTGKCLDTVRGGSPFISVAVSQQLLCAGDANGNIWHLYFMASTPHEKDLRTKTPIRLFFSYSHRDEALRDELETHLALLKREGLLQSWHDRRIGAGDEWAGQIDRNLDEAEVILLLVSADFLASDYCFDKEMKRALARHDAGQARVIPVILRKTDWRSAPFARLLALPKDGRPVTLWQDRDEAWTDVALGIRSAIEGLRVRSG
ncbi:TIR domain-containing protein [Sorangium sp. So ce1151]|uniref:TIR domain-containing protein n=1 Tax=Sorangium sp. So ce1151 TaxID=3133332 RepID=UPI003F5FFBB3